MIRYDNCPVSARTKQEPLVIEEAADPGRDGSAADRRLERRSGDA